MTDPKYLREHYAVLSDEALVAVDRRDLRELARVFYDEELGRRRSKNEAPPNVPFPPTPPVSPRLWDVRRAALLACVATVLGIAMPMWNSTRQIFALESKIGLLGTLSVIVVLYLLTAIVPLFHFALYRNEGDLLISRNMAWLAMIAVVVFGTLTVGDLSRWIDSFRHESVMDVARRHWTVGDTSNAFGCVANVAAILVLVSLFRLSGEGAERGVVVSKLLRVSTKVAIIAGGLVAVGCVVGLAATPWVYFSIRDRLLEMGHSNTPSMFWRLAADRARMALTVVFVFVAPFVVRRTRRARVTSDETSS